MDPTRSEEGNQSSPSEGELQERVGTLINERYRVLRLIGHGSTGAVYACQHVGLDKLVALKVLHREMEENASFVERFKLEAKAASRLEHPNSVRVLDFGHDPGTGALFIAMEYIEGRDLLQVLDEDGPFTAERAVTVMTQILDVLGVAHGLGIVHRDLKPENILLRTVEEDGQMREHVTVCDFGIAQLGLRSGGSNASGHGAGHATASATGEAVPNPDGEEGLVAGTPAYMSPEQARAEPQDARSDLYSAGVVLYQLLTLQLPFYAEDAYSLALKHCVEVPPPPSRFGAVSPQLEEICLKALSKSRDARYQSAREMRQALQRVLTGTSEAQSASAEGSGAPRRWGAPRQLGPQVTPPDAPVVELSPSPSVRSMPGPRNRPIPVWRWSLAGLLAVGGMTYAGVILSHRQDPRTSASAAAASKSASSGPDAAEVTRDSAETHESGAPETVVLAASSVEPLPDRAHHQANETDGDDHDIEGDATARSGEPASAAGKVSSSGTPRQAPTSASAEDSSATSHATSNAEAAPTRAVSEGSSKRPNSAIAASAREQPSQHGAPSDPLANGTDGANGERLRDHASRSAQSEVSAKTAGVGLKDSKRARAQVDEGSGSTVTQNSDDDDSALELDDLLTLGTRGRANRKDEVGPSGSGRASQAALDLELELLPDEAVELGNVSAESERSEAKTGSHATLVSQLAQAPGKVLDDAASRSEPVTPARGVSNDATDVLAKTVETPAPVASTARVAIRRIDSRSGVSKQSVRTALNLSAITDCYRSAIRSGGVSGNRVVAPLELSTSQSGSVIEASLDAPELPVPLRHCVEQIVRRGRVREADTGSAQATIVLAFLPR